MMAVTDNLRETAQEIRYVVKDLLLGHSSIRRWNVNRPGNAVFWTGPDCAWNPLNEEGRRIQSRALEEYTTFYAILSSLVRNQPSQNIAELREQDSTIRDTIQQSDMPWHDRLQEHYDDFSEALNKELTLLEGLYDSSDGSVIYAPDTNALLFNPELEKWRFKDSPRFIILLTPTVLSELDTLKVNHRVESVRKKAESLIRRIKGYRTRGRLTDGVPLVTNISQLITCVCEPDFDETLPWLDRTNNDDRIRAVFVEVMRQHPRSTVILVTRDINLQSKADFARLLFLEPPVP